MKYLFDTDVFVKALSAPATLNRRALNVITRQAVPLYFSAASAWEISTKYGLGKLRLPEPPGSWVMRWIRDWNMNVLDITCHHALAAGGLRLLHRDPFDRVLIAQAQVEHLVLMTCDRMFEQYDVQVLWCGR